jgi:uncharacterized protein YjiS (DUF1127 family)
MHDTISCTAAFALLRCGKRSYIGFDDSVPTQKLNPEFKETTMLLSLIRMIQAFRDYQRNVAELSQLSDRELADIGLDRSDIPRVAAGNYSG